MTLYCLTILQRINTVSEKIKCQAVILCPSGELIEQVFECLTNMGAALKIEVFGAVENYLSEEDKEIFELGVHVVIATPKLISVLMRDKYIKAADL